MPLEFRVVAFVEKYFAASLQHSTAATMHLATHTVPEPLANAPIHPVIVVANWFEALAHRDYMRVCALYAQDATVSSPPGVLRGIAQVHQHYRFRCLSGALYHRRQWDVQYRIDSASSSDEIVVANWRFRWSLPNVSAPVTQCVGSSFSVTALGLIREQHDDFSTVGLARQILPIRQWVGALVTGSLARAICHLEADARAMTHSASVASRMRAQISP